MENEDIIEENKELNEEILKLYLLFFLPAFSQHASLTRHMLQAYNEVPYIFLQGAYFRPSF